MTVDQRIKVALIISRATLGYKRVEFHHGDCIGADVQAHELTIGIVDKVVSHPQANDRFRAFVVADEILGAKGYLVRSKDIVDASDRLIATPRRFEEEMHSDTWSTIRYARKMRTPRLIVWPDGRLKYEDDSVSIEERQ